MEGKSNINQQQGSRSTSRNRSAPGSTAPRASASTPAPLWKVPDVAACLGITPKGVYGLVEKRRIPFLRIGNRLRFEPGRIRDWIQQKRVEAAGR